MLWYLQPCDPLPPCSIFCYIAVLWIVPLLLWQIWVSLCFHSLKKRLRDWKPRLQTPVTLGLQIRVWPLLAFYVGTGNINSGLHACTARVLPTETSQSPYSIIFNKYIYILCFSSFCTKLEMELRALQVLGKCLTPEFHRQSFKQTSLKNHQ